ncbi:MAG: hypothetical protein V4754_19750 [Pseudomonadota bacterium]
MSRRTATHFGPVWKKTIEPAARDIVTAIATAAANIAAGFSQDLMRVPCPWDVTITWRRIANRAEMSAMNSPFELTQWQKKQAAMLYHFASMEYLKGLQQRVNDLIAFVEPTLDLARRKTATPGWSLSNGAPATPPKIGATTRGLFWPIFRKASLNESPSGLLRCFTQAVLAIAPAA